uniref:Mediator of RNA polymerase II transcription subunit 4 n=1 Tax=Syphacia muris TaxID=451379 RepID=A0A0N5AV63_9BILA
MSDDRSLRERLQDAVDDLDAIVKQLVIRVIDKDRSSESVTSLSKLFHSKQAELKKILSKVTAHREREKVIKNLNKAIASRNATIAEIENELRGAEFALTKAVYQAGIKIKLMRQAEARRVNSEQVIRFANQISRWYSVAAPLGWQYGDPSRPFPTEAELRLSALAAPRVNAPSAQPALSLLRHQGASSSSPNMMRGSGRGSPVAAAYSSGALHQQRTWSPRGSFAQQSSPRGRGTRGSGVMSPRVNISGSSLMQHRSTGSGSPHVSPSNPYHISGKGVHPPVKNVEQMSSDSSSSSSSDEGSPV